MAGTADPIEDVIQTDDVFDLDITLLELTDTASLINSTDDGCGSTCGACTTNCG